MSNPNQLRPPRKCGVPELSKWEHAVATEVRGLLTALHASGVSMVDVGVSIGVARRTLYRWRTGEDSIPASMLLALRELAAERGSRKAACP